MIINTNRHLGYVLGSSPKEFTEIISNLPNYYYHKRQPKKKYGDFQRDEKGNIKCRDLYPSVYRLKQIQRRINVLLQQMELPAYMYGSVKGRNNVLNARQHIQNKYFLTIDLKNYFSNISHRQVFKMLVEKRFSHEVSRILTQLTTFRGSLPQGAPTSPIIANLVFEKTGNQLLELVKDRHIVFTTYQDDLSFSSNNDFKSIVPSILHIIKSGGFYLQYKKIHYRTRTPEVTGLIIQSGQLWLVRDMQERAKVNSSYNGYVKLINNPQLPAFNYNSFNNNHYPF